MLHNFIINCSVRDALQLLDVGLLTLCYFLANDLGFRVSISDSRNFGCRPLAMPPCNSTGNEDLLLWLCAPQKEIEPAIMWLRRTMQTSLHGTYSMSFSNKGYQSASSWFSVPVNVIFFCGQ